MRITKIPTTEDSLNKAIADLMVDSAQDYLNEGDVKGLQDEFISHITKVWVRAFHYGQSH